MGHRRNQRGNVKSGFQQMKPSTQHIKICDKEEEESSLKSMSLSKLERHQVNGINRYLKGDRKPAAKSLQELKKNKKEITKAREETNQIET